MPFLAQFILWTWNMVWILKHGVFLSIFNTFHSDKCFQLGADVLFLSIKAFQWFRIGSLFLIGTWKFQTGSSLSARCDEFQMLSSVYQSARSEGTKSQTYKCQVFQSPPKQLQSALCTDKLSGFLRFCLKNTNVLNWINYFVYRDTEFGFEKCFKEIIITKFITSKTKVF